jgi:hypothetical protein
MSLLFRRLTLAASLVMVFSVSTLANASQIRNAVERKLHPGTSFFIKSDACHRHVNTPSSTLFGLLRSR